MGVWLLGLVALFASPALATATLPAPATSSTAILDRVTVDGLAAALTGDVASAESPALAVPPGSGFSLRPAPLGDYGQLFERGERFVEPLPRFDVEPLRLPETRVRAFALFDTPSRLPSNRVSDGSATGFGLCLADSCGGPIETWLSEDPAGTVDSPSLYAFVGHQPNMGIDPFGLFDWKRAAKAAARTGWELGTGFVQGVGGSLPVVRLLPGFAPKSTDTTERRTGQIAGSTLAEVAGFQIASSGGAEAVVGCSGAVLLVETGPVDAIPAAACAGGVGKVMAGSAVMMASGQYQASAVQTGTSGSVNDGAEPPGENSEAEPSTGRVRDPKTGRFVSDPDNPPSPNKMTDAQRRAAWRRLAEDPNSSLTPEQRAEIKARGWRGPQRVNPKSGELETMELSHEPVPARQGGTEVTPRWPEDHAAIDPHRQLKKPEPPQGQ